MNCPYCDKETEYSGKCNDLYMCTSQDNSLDQLYHRLLARDKGDGKKLMFISFFINNRKIVAFRNFNIINNIAYNEYYILVEDFSSLTKLKTEEELNHYLNKIKVFS